MEFKFPVNDLFKEPIVEINNALIPPGFTGDRRAYWDAMAKVSEVINAMGEASATAQGLTKPITTADRLRNSEQTVYLLVDKNAANGRGAVTGMLKTGKKGLYVFDKNGTAYQVQPHCVLDFYVHESRQRTGLGKRLFEHMLQNETVEPVKMAIDRPSEKFLGFLRKHYTLDDPIKQMNNYVVFGGFFKGDAENEESAPVNYSNGTPGKKQSANGLQTTSFMSPMGRYGAPRPPCSMGQIIHNQTSTVQKTPEPQGVQSAPATNYQNHTLRSTPNPVNVSQSAPNMSYPPAEATAQFAPTRNQQQSENVWQSMGQYNHMGQEGFYNQQNQAQQQLSAQNQQQVPVYDQQQSEKMMQTQQVPMYNHQQSEKMMQTQQVPMYSQQQSEKMMQTQQVPMYSQQQSEKMMQTQQQLLAQNQQGPMYNQQQSEKMMQAQRQNEQVPMYDQQQSEKMMQTQQGPMYNQQQSDKMMQREQNEQVSMYNQQQSEEMMRAQRQNEQVPMYEQQQSEKMMQTQQVPMYNQQQSEKIMQRQLLPQNQHQVPMYSQQQSEKMIQAQQQVQAQQQQILAQQLLAQQQRMQMQQLQAQQAQQIQQQTQNPPTEGLQVQPKQEQVIYPQQQQMQSPQTIMGNQNYGMYQNMIPSNPAVSQAILTPRQSQQMYQNMIPSNSAVSQTILTPRQSQQMAVPPNTVMPVPSQYTQLTPQPYMQPSVTQIPTQQFGLQPQMPGYSQSMVQPTAPMAPAQPLQYSQVGQIPQQSTIYAPTTQQHIPYHTYQMPQYTQSTPVVPQQPYVANNMIPQPVIQPTITQSMPAMSDKALSSQQPSPMHLTQPQSMPYTTKPIMSQPQIPQYQQQQHVEKTPRTENFSHMEGNHQATSARKEEVQPAHDAKGDMMPQAIDENLMLKYGYPPQTPHIFKRIPRSNVLSLSGN